MKHRLLELLCCPVCYKTLELEVFNTWDRDFPDHIFLHAQCRNWCSLNQCSPDEVTAEQCSSCYRQEVVDAKLTCTNCGSQYPVVGGIPRMLKSQLLTESLASYHQDFIDRYGDRFKHLAKKKKSEERKKLATLHLFGYQWTTFVKNFSYFKEIFLGFVRPFLTSEDFANKLVLDVGCGSGRPASVAASFGAEVVGVDLSEAVQTAHSLSTHYPLLHVVQGDAYALPFKPCFDFVYCVGVIQHVPDPSAVLMSISRVVAPGRRLIIWVYGIREFWYQPIEWLRKLTVKLPFTILRVLSYVLAVLTEITFLMPYRILTRIPFLEKVAKKIPGRIYANFPFRENVIGWFDRLGAPVTYYFSKEDVENMLNNAEFERIEVVARPDASASWVASAIRKSSSL